MWELFRLNLPNLTDHKVNMSLKKLSPKENGLKVCFMVKENGCKTMATRLKANGLAVNSKVRASIRLKMLALTKASSRIVWSMVLV